MMPRSVLSGMIYILVGLVMIIVAISMHELEMPLKSAGAVALAGTFMLVLGLYVVNYPGDGDEESDEEPV